MGVFVKPTAPFLGHTRQDVEDDWPEQVVQRLLALEELTCQAHEAPTLTAVLVRGLQGSGKSTLCRALAQLTMGQWINQDEVSKGAERLFALRIARKSMKIMVTSRC